MANVKKLYPFIETFKLYKEGYRLKDIMKELKLTRATVDAITHGHALIPKELIEDVKALGFKICTCCGKRIVPIYPINGVYFTRLCRQCWKGNSGKREGGIFIRGCRTINCLL